MKRRNVLYGLGLAGLASSVTALTGATLAETVTPTAEFRVNVEPDFFVRAARSTDTVDVIVDLTATENFAGATSPSGEFTDGTAAAALETVAENKPGDLTARGGQIDLLDTVFLGTG